MTHSTRRLILFSRYPQPGRTKTRLIPALGAEGAAALHRELTEYLLGEVAKVDASELEIRFAGDGEAMRRWLVPVATTAGAPRPRFAAQGDGDLGERMLRGFVAARDEQVERALLFGCDIPGLRAEILERAFDALNEHDVVLGPARDGGYYLIGAKAPHPALFEPLPWGAAEVRERTLERAASQGLTVALVDELVDVDDPSDLAAMRAIPSLAHWAR